MTIRWANIPLLKIALVLVFFAYPTFAIPYDCSGPVFDYESGNYLDSTDHETKCEEAVEEACDNAYSACVLECPSEVYDYDSGTYLYSTDVNSKCEDACLVAKSSCEP